MGIARRNHRPEGLHTMPIRKDLSQQQRNQLLLQYGEQAGWWKYESENQPGYRDESGLEYHVTTYTLRLESADDDHELILLEGEIEGFVLATALQWGDDAVEAISYRPGIVPPGTPNIPPE